MIQYGKVDFLWHTCVSSFIESVTKKPFTDNK